MPDAENRNVAPSIGGLKSQTQCVRNAGDFAIFRAFVPNVLTALAESSIANAGQSVEWLLCQESVRSSSRLFSGFFDSPPWTRE